MRIGIVCMVFISQLGNGLLIKYFILLLKQHLLIG